MPQGHLFVSSYLSPPSLSVFFARATFLGERQLRPVAQLGLQIQPPCSWLVLRT